MLLGATGVKAARKMFVKLTTDDVEYNRPIRDKEKKSLMKRFVDDVESTCSE
jgi:hypothetical protein